MWYDKLANKLKRFALPGLMKYVVIGMAAVYILNIFSGGRLTGLLAFSLPAIARGQIWRLISFVFIPINSSPLFIFFALYFYWLIGDALERDWGTAKFNLFYLTGVLGTIIAGLITGYATNHYLNLTLFFAFAILFPSFQLLLFFVLPVKIKWLAYINAAYFVWEFIISSWPRRLALLVAVGNLLLFFLPGIKNQIHNYRRRKAWRDNFR